MEALRVKSKIEINTGLVNKYNFHYCDNRNPHYSTRLLFHQHRWSINVRGEILDEFVSGPFFIVFTMTLYLNFLENNLRDSILNVSLNIWTIHIWILHDGVLLHNAIYAKKIKFTAPK